VAYCVGGKCRKITVKAILATLDFVSRPRFDIFSFNLYFNLTYLLNATATLMNQRAPAAPTSRLWIRFLRDVLFCQPNTDGCNASQSFVKLSVYLFPWSASGSHATDVTVKQCVRISVEVHPGNVTEVWQTSSSEDFHNVLFDRQFIQDVCVTSVISSRAAENFPRHWHLKDM